MKNSKVLTIGEALVDFIPNQKGCALKDVQEFERVPGGAPANVAAAVSILGGQSHFIGKVGDDAFGELLIDVLKSNGVSTEYMVKTKEAKTALAFVSLKEDGDRDFSFYRNPSADMLLDNTEIHSTWFNKGDILHYGSISLISEPSRSATKQAILEASRKSCLLSYDPNLRLPLWENEETAREVMLEYLQFAHIVKVSEEELEFLTNIEDEKEAVGKLFTDKMILFIVTKGKYGATYYTENGEGHVKSMVIKAADTTGAGDAFVGGLLYQLNRMINSGEDVFSIPNNPKKIEEILAFSNTCGAITSMKLGAISSLPTLKEVEEFLVKR
ncbi:PfkB family carbohydrate kinase [Metabacillus litoralis]|uniref:PfkB family carbohydrate kinase n=1 Tax=Metabacillus litoralis TaxID=152268 RepID=UPI001CFEFB4C|nr:PfkB family carbohydrate kinase [Metabacillus litoralis]